MTDRLVQARAEAERQYETGHITFAQAHQPGGFLSGVEWADANPEPRTITREELGAAADEFTAAGTTGEWVSIEGMLIEALGALGIEVSDEAYRVHAGGS